MILSMFRILYLAILIFASHVTFAQSSTSLTEAEASRIIGFLASDSMKGRGNGRPELLRAGKFIAKEFHEAGLSPLSSLSGYFLPFSNPERNVTDIAEVLYANGRQIPQWQFMFAQRRPLMYETKRLGDFKVIKLDTCFTDDVLEQYSSSSPLLLWTDRKQPMGEGVFPEVTKIPSSGLMGDVLMVYSVEPPVSLELVPNDAYYSSFLYNIVGMIPGKTRPNEIIVFSSHYDHMGVIPSRKDSIMNGANDNASGTTALIMLAKYFAQKGDNERTIMFCAFAGEELGLLGSYEFVKILNPTSVVAVINMEMIGVRQSRKDRVFITGERHSDLPKILKKNLEKNAIRVVGEPSENHELFKRSDNFPFALKGIPAHTVMVSDDHERCYHLPCDEMKRIDIPNMTRVIRAIAFSVTGLIAGEETPGRISGRLVN